MRRRSRRVNEASSPWDDMLILLDDGGIILCGHDPAVVTIRRSILPRRPEIDSKGITALALNSGVRLGL